MDNIKKSPISAVVFILLVFGIFFIISSNNQTRSKSSDTVVKKSFIGSDISSASQITCTYSQTLSASYMNNVISHVLPPPEKNPMIFTFSQIDDPKVGQLSYIDSTQTITNVPIIKLSEDADKIIYVDGLGQSYLTIHTIYKKMSIATFAKNVNLLDIIPSVTSAMGTCVGY